MMDCNIAPPMIEMMENDKWKTEYSSINNGVSPPSFLLRHRYGRNFSGKGIFKNTSTCENAVARKYFVK